MEVRGGRQRAGGGAARRGLRAPGKGLHRRGGPGSGEGAPGAARAPGGPEGGQGSSSGPAAPAGEAPSPADPGVLPGTPVPGPRQASVGRRQRLTMRSSGKAPMLQRRPASPAASFSMARAPRRPVPRGPGCAPAATSGGRRAPRLAARPGREHHVAGLPAGRRPPPLAPPPGRLPGLRQVPPPRGARRPPLRERAGDRGDRESRREAAQKRQVRSGVCGVGGGGRPPRPAKRVWTPFPAGSGAPPPHPPCQGPRESPPPAPDPASLPEAPAPNSPATTPAALSSLTQPGAAASLTHLLRSKLRLHRRRAAAETWPLGWTANPPAVPGRRRPRGEHSARTERAPPLLAAAAPAHRGALSPRTGNRCRGDPGGPPSAAPSLSSLFLSVLRTPPSNPCSPGLRPLPKPIQKRRWPGPWHRDGGLPSSPVCLQRRLQAVGRWCRSVRPARSGKAPRMGPQPQYTHTCAHTYNTHAHTHNMHAHTHTCAHSHTCARAQRTRAHTRAHTHTKRNDTRQDEHSFSARGDTVQVSVQSPSFAEERHQDSKGRNAWLEGHTQGRHRAQTGCLPVMPPNPAGPEHPQGALSSCPEAFSSFSPTQVTLG